MNAVNLFNNKIWPEVIEKVYGFKTYKLISHDNSNLSLTHIYSPILKNILVSGPYVTYNDPVIYSEDGFEDIINKAIDLCKEKGCSYIELGSSKPLNLNWEVSKDQVSFKIDLSSGPDYLFKHIGRKVRGAILRGQKNNLYYKIGSDYINDFFRIYSISVKRLGTPVHSLNFFNELVKTSKDFNVMVVFNSDDIAISSVLFAVDEDTIYPLAAGGLKEYIHLSADSFKYWKLIEYGCELSKKYFDYGRSPKDSGSYHFKKRWCAEEQQLYYYFYFNKPSKIITRESMKYKAFSCMWRKIPVSVSRLVGPYLRKYIP